jgi:hypothetical protein
VRVIVLTLRSAVKLEVESVKCLCSVVGELTRCKEIARTTIEEQRNTLVCIFDPTSPCISAYEIHEWIHDQLQVLHHSLTMIQIDGTKRHVFLNFVDDTFIHNVLQTTNGRVEYKHVTRGNFSSSSRSGWHGYATYPDCQSAPRGTGKNPSSSSRTIWRNCLNP